MQILEFGNPKNKKIINQVKKYIISEGKIDDFINVVDNITDETIINYVKAIGKYKCLKI